MTNNLYIGTLNVTLDHTQYKKENCDQCSGPSTFSVWVCAEDFNPDWWAKHTASVAKRINPTTWVIVLMLIMVCLPRKGVCYFSGAAV